MTEKKTAFVKTAKLHSNLASVEQVRAPLT